MQSVVAGVFGAVLQGPAESVEQISLVSPVPESVLVDPAAYLSTMAEPSFANVGGGQDGDGLGEFVAHRVRSRERDPAPRSLNQSA